MLTAALKEDDSESEDTEALDAARAELREQARALEQVAAQLDDSFCEALRLVAACRGRVIVTGMGKSGNVARKLAATLSCSGTPALFLHPGDACHGDLGVVTSDDVVILVSHSGETAELRWLLPHLDALGVPKIALTGSARSTLARAASLVLDVSIESSPGSVVPTTSALVAQAVGDAIALAVMRRRGLAPADVARLHPGSPSAEPPESG